MKIALFSKRIEEGDSLLLTALFQKIWESTSKEDTQEEFYFCPELVRWIQAHLPPYQEGIKSFTDVLPENTEVVLSLGGDGTLLDTLSLVKDSGVPVFGLNLGHLGFLSGIGREEVALALQGLFSGLYVQDERGVLQVCSQSLSCFPKEEEKHAIQGSNEAIFSKMFPYALNEVVVFKCDTDSLISIKVSVNGAFLNTYYGDGVVFATPTGSTAYSLSCGGPILLPQADNLLITPVASHTLTVRPVVLPGDAQIEIQIEGTKEFKVSLDSKIYTLQSPFTFFIRKASFRFSTLRLKDRSFFDVIREKLMWGANARNSN
ncbi:MAG: NAD(+)/NADH kinase [Bacteroidales bacterium]